MSAGTHWAARYVGLPYTEADCAALAARVLAEEFGKRVPVEAEDRAPSALGRARQVEAAARQFVRVEAPQEGDLVVMRCRGRPSHVGVLACVGGVDHVLHALKRQGSACLHKVRELPRLGLAVEGFYRV